MGKTTKVDEPVEPVAKKKMTYSESVAESAKNSRKNHERFLKTIEKVQQARGNAQAVAKLRWALGLEDKTTKS